MEILLKKNLITVMLLVLLGGLFVSTTTYAGLFGRPTIGGDNLILYKPNIGEVTKVKQKIIKEEQEILEKLKNLANQIPDEKLKYFVKKKEVFNYSSSGRKVNNADVKSYIIEMVGVCQHLLNEIERSIYSPNSKVKIEELDQIIRKMDNYMKDIKHIGDKIVLLSDIKTEILYLLAKNRRLSSNIVADEKLLESINSGEFKNQYRHNKYK